MLLTKYLGNSCWKE